LDALIATENNKSLIWIGRLIFVKNATPSSTIRATLEVIEVNESEVKLKMKVKELEERILRIEKALITVPHTLNQGGSHANDGGWFD
jgi:hypothetical protein